MSFIVDGRWTGPVVDQHIHLDRSNRYLSAIEEFVRVGGTGLMLVHKPGFSGALPIDKEGYRRAYSETILMAEEVRKKFAISVGVVIGLTLLRGSAKYLSWELIEQANYI